MRSVVQHSYYQVLFSPQVALSYALTRNLSFYRHRCPHLQIPYASFEDRRGHDQREWNWRAHDKRMRGDSRKTNELVTGEVVSAVAVFPLCLQNHLIA